MALEISIYNRQKQVSKQGKEYVGYAVAFTPGQRGALPSSADVPPFYILETSAAAHSGYAWEHEPCKKRRRRRPNSSMS